MNVVKWNPWKEMDTFSGRVNRFFDGSLVPSIWMNEESPLSNWKPAADIYDQDDKIVIKAELPGVDKKDLRVDLKDNVLSLEGERSSEKEVKEENYYRKERVHGRFSRSFVLPNGVDTERINAEFKDGVLNIEIPKPNEMKRKEISVH